MIFVFPYSRFCFLQRATAVKVACDPWSFVPHSSKFRAASKQNIDWWLSSPSGAEGPAQGNDPCAQLCASAHLSNSCSTDGLTRLTSYNVDTPVNTVELIISTNFKLSQNTTCADFGSSFACRRLTLDQYHMEAIQTKLPCHNLMNHNYSRFYSWMRADELPVTLVTKMVYSR